MKKLVLVMLVLVGLLLPIGALGFDIFCKNNGEIEYFVLKTGSESYSGSTILTCDIDEDYRGACHTKLKREGWTLELLKTIEPIYKQYVQYNYDNKICKVLDKDLNDITPYSKKTEVKKEPEAESPKEDEGDIDVASCYYTNSCEE